MQYFAVFSVILLGVYLVGFIRGDKIAVLLSQKSTTRKLTWGETIVCIASISIVLMWMTQQQAVKALPYIVSNLLALGTMLPLAIAALIVASILPVLLKSEMVKLFGVISYEVFLIQPIALRLADYDIIGLIVYLLVMVAMSYGLHSGCEQIESRNRTKQIIIERDNHG